MNTTRCRGFGVCNIKKNTRTMSLARCFGLVGYVIKKKTMMMSAMFVIVVLELIAQEQNRYDECNSSS